jgi:hypothetical protein
MSFVMYCGCLRRLSRLRRLSCLSRLSLLFELWSWQAPCLSKSWVQMFWLTNGCALGLWRSTRARPWTQFEVGRPTAAHDENKVQLWSLRFSTLALVIVGNCNIISAYDCNRMHY